VAATDGSRTVRAELSGRFVQAIDAAAMKAGLVGMDEYLDEWRRETRPCDGDLDRVVTDETARLEAEFTDDVLRRLVEAGGIREA
jgi:hypothetical protein